MKKTMAIIYTLACTIGLLVGFAHLFAPYAFGWYSYIPDAPLEIIQSINYVNFCFSFLLAGLSLLLLVVHKAVFSHAPGLRAFYGFYVLVWFSRVIIQLAWPWPSHLQLWLVVGFVVEFILTLLPALWLFKPSSK